MGICGLGSSGVVWCLGVASGGLGYKPLDISCNTFTAIRMYTIERLMVKCVSNIPFDFKSGMLSMISVVILASWVLNKRCVQANRMMSKMGTSASCAANVPPRAPLCAAPRNLRRHMQRTRPGGRAISRASEQATTGLSPLLLFAPNPPDSKGRSDVCGAAWRQLLLQLPAPLAPSFESTYHRLPHSM